MKWNPTEARAARKTWGQIERTLITSFGEGFSDEFVLSYTDSDKTNRIFDSVLWELFKMQWDRPHLREMHLQIAPFGVTIAMCLPACASAIPLEVHERLPTILLGPPDGVRSVNVAPDGSGEHPLLRELAYLGYRYMLARAFCPSDPFFAELDRLMNEGMPFRALSEGMKEQEAS